VLSLQFARVTLSRSSLDKMSAMIRRRNPDRRSETTPDAAEKIRGIQSALPQYTSGSPRFSK